MHDGEIAEQAEGLDLEDCWQAVLARDSAYDQAFVYAVRTTGIYCRPSCPSRRPRREHVQFFAQPEQAEQAGFRPCLRCHPRQGVLPEQHIDLVQQMCRFLEERVDDPPALEEMGRCFHLSPYHLQRVFKRVLGVTPRQYSEACRLDSFKAQIRAGVPVTEALYAAGFGSSSGLYERIPDRLGMTPTVYRSGGAGMEITYTLADCSLGRLLVAATERGLCAVSMADTDAELVAALHAEYPQADIHYHDPQHNPWLADLLRYLEGHQPHLDLPLDVQATAFQAQVWQALREIPYGSTRTYGELARQLGQPGAARAVGRACATNPVSLVVPCHRAVREDGGLGGYRWGLERKQQLLTREAAQQMNGAADSDL